MCISKALGRGNQIICFSKDSNCLCAKNQTNQTGPFKGEYQTPYWERMSLFLGKSIKSIRKSEWVTRSRLLRITVASSGQTKPPSSYRYGIAICKHKDAHFAICKTFAQIYSCCRSIKTSEMLEGKLQATQSVFLYASNDLNLNSSVNWTWIVKNAIYCSLMLTINLNMVFEKILD